MNSKLLMLIAILSIIDAATAECGGMWNGNEPFNVTGDVICENEEFNLTQNLNIFPGGNLTLINVKLLFMKTPGMAIPGIITRSGNSTATQVQLTIMEGTNISTNASWSGLGSESNNTFINTLVSVPWVPAYSPIINIRDSHFSHLGNETTGANRDGINLNACRTGMCNIINNTFRDGLFQISMGYKVNGVMIANNTFTNVRGAVKSAGADEIVIDSNTYHTINWTNGGSNFFVQFGTDSRNINITNNNITSSYGYSVNLHSECDNVNVSNNIFRDTDRSIVLNRGTTNSYFGNNSLYTNPENGGGFGGFTENARNITYKDNIVYDTSLGFGTSVVFRNNSDAYFINNYVNDTQWCFAPIADYIVINDQQCENEGTWRAWLTTYGFKWYSHGNTSHGLYNSNHIVSNGGYAHGYDFNFWAANITNHTYNDINLTGSLIYDAYFGENVTDFSFCNASFNNLTIAGSDTQVNVSEKLKIITDINTSIGLTVSSGGDTWFSGTSDANGNFDYFCLKDYHQVMVGIVNITTYLFSLSNLLPDSNYNVTENGIHVANFATAGDGSGSFNHHPGWESPITLDIVDQLEPTTTTSTTTTSSSSTTTTIASGSTTSTIAAPSTTTAASNDTRGMGGVAFGLIILVPLIIILRFVAKDDQILR